MTVYNRRLLIADDSTDALHEIKPFGSDTEGGILRILPAGLTGPFGMTVYNGRLLIADLDNELWEIDPDGADTQGDLLRALPQMLLQPFGMTVYNGRLLVLYNPNVDNDFLLEIDPDGADTQGGDILRRVPDGLGSGRSMTAYNGRLLIADVSFPGRKLWEIDPDGADTQGDLLQRFPAELVRPYGMASFFGSEIRVGNNTENAETIIITDGSGTAKDVRGAYVTDENAVATQVF